MYCTVQDVVLACGHGFWGHPEIVVCHVRTMVLHKACSVAKAQTLADLLITVKRSKPEKARSTLITLDTQRTRRSS